MGDHSRQRRRSIRMPNWDYRQTGAYFVTVCTHNRQCLFDGPLVARALRIEWGRAVCAGRLPEESDFVVMPNHIHGIVWIDHQVQSFAHEDASRHKAGCLPGSLGAKVGGFKSASAKRLKTLLGMPDARIWQRNYHERVLRNERELRHAQQYIIDNPTKWAEDKENPANFEAIPYTSDQIDGT